MRTSFLNTSLSLAEPSEARSVTVARHSRGSELRIVNGTRTGFPSTPTVGQSRLDNSRSGNRVELPTATAITGTLANRRPCAAWSGGSPSLKSPSEASTTLRRFENRSVAVASGA